MLRVALRGIRAHLVRFVMSLLAVALGVAFVAGTFSLRSMLSGTFDEIVDAGSTADLYVRAAPDEEPEDEEGPSAIFAASQPVVPVSLADELAGLDGVARAWPEVSGQVVLVGADGTAVQAGQAPSIAVAWRTDDPTVTFPTGRGPASDGEIALELGALARSGLAVGDVTSLVVGGEVREVTVVGAADMGGSMAGATLVLISEAEALEAFAPQGLVSTLGLDVRDGADAAEVSSAVESVLADAETTAPLEVVTGEEVAQESKDAIAEVLGFITTFLLVFAAIALFVGAFIIANTFAMSVRQRMREFALLRAVGASPAQVFTSILVQAAVVGLIGSAIGVAGGIGLVIGLRAVLAQMGMELAGEIPVDPSSIAISIGVGTVVSVVAAAMPARRAALVPPVEAMREEITVRERSLHVRAWFGVALMAGGVAALVVATGRPEAENAPIWLGVGAGACLLGMLVVAPVLARAVLSVLAWPAVRALPPIGQLARGNVVRSPRRTANTAGALMIGMALVGAATVIASSTQASVADVVARETRADLILTSASGSIPSGAVEDVAALPQVADVFALSYAGAQITTADGAALEQTSLPVVTGLAAQTFREAFAVEVLDGDPVTALEAGEAVVNTTYASGVAVGDELTLLGASGTPVTVRVGALLDSSIPRAAVTVSPATLAEVAPEAEWTTDSAYVMAADAVDEASLKEAVTDAVAPYVVVSVLTSEEFVSQLSAQVDRVLVILYALLGLSIVIAVLGIVNTLALSVIERTREIGLLRAVGLGRLQLAGTITVESVLTAVFGTVVGLIVGVGLAATLPTVFADDGLNTLAIPWWNLLGMLVLAVLVGVLAAVWPAVRAARLRVLDAVSYE